MNILLRFILLLGVPLHAATYYVSTNGSDSADGSSSTPWRTIQKAADTMVAGDTSLIHQGIYDEYVDVDVANGTEASRISLRCAVTNSPVVTKQFRVQRPYWTLDGFHIVAPADEVKTTGNANLAGIRAEPRGSYLWITNCVFRDWQYIISTNCNFEHTSNAVIFTHGDLSASRILNGAYVYFGSDSMKQYTNCNGSWRVKGITDNTLYVTNSSADSFLVEQRTNFWAFIHAGANNPGYDAIYLVLGTGVEAPTNCVISGCTISNIFGAAFAISGDGTVVENNKITELHSGELLRVRSSTKNLTVRNNHAWNLKNVIWFTGKEYALAPHPLGVGAYDYNVGLIHLQGTNMTNIVFEKNWVEAPEQQIAFLGGETNNYDSHTCIVRSNVFVGGEMAVSANINRPVIENNTFYRASYDAASVLALGGTGGVLQSNLSLRSNVFISCGWNKTHYEDGFYSFELMYQHTNLGNYAVGPETTGWATKDPANSNSVQYSGSPLLINPLDPDGADNLPFTADDGIRPMSNSILAVYGLGALTPAATVGPVAHFQVISPTNWTDYYYTNWNQAYTNTPPGSRGQNIRPWTTPDPIGNAPVLATFSASNSLDGINGLTNSGITGYFWTWGDGRACNSNSTITPLASHEYVSTGTFLVTLTITNTVGQTHTASNLYRVLPSTNFSRLIRYVSNTGNDLGTGSELDPYLTVTNALARMTSGCYTVVKSGTYYEYLNFPKPGTNDAPIRLIGLDRPIIWKTNNSEINVFDIRYSYVEIDGFDVVCSNLLNNHQVFYLFNAASQITVSNNRIRDGTNTVLTAVIVCVTPPSGQDNPVLNQKNCLFTNNIIANMTGIAFRLDGSNHLVAHNVVRDLYGEADLVRMNGANHIIRANYASNLVAGWTGGHADVLQVFGNGGGIGSNWCKDIIFERNHVVGTGGRPGDFDTNGIALCQMEMDSRDGYFYLDYPNFQTQLSNVVIRNNIFENIAGTGSWDINGLKCYNNLFYYCGFRSGGNHVFVLGGTKGSSWGCTFTNNIFYVCGNSNQYGWWPPNPYGGITNFNVDGDYNFVATTNYAAVPNADWTANGNNANSINGGNPDWVSEALRNFRLATTNSPLHNSGVTVAGYSDDFQATPRYPPWDIGPYEGEAGGEEPPVEPETNTVRKASLRGNQTWRGNVRIQ